MHWNDCRCRFIVHIADSSALEPIACPSFVILSASEESRCPACEILRFTQDDNAVLDCRTPAMQRFFQKSCRHSSLVILSVSEESRSAQRVRCFVALSMTMLYTRSTYQFTQSMLNRSIDRHLITYCGVTLVVRRSWP